MKIGLKIKSWKKEIKGYPLIYTLLALILLLAFFVRAYRTGDLLRFYFDQGRDALVIWRLWHEGRPFLIGPVTGLAGIFLGPFYYYLIAPFYLIGGGNPVYPAVFLAFLSTLAVFMVYFLGWKMHSRAAGIIAATITGFSYYVFKTSRWLSNPNPILLTSMLFLWSLWEIANGGKKYWWFLAAFFAGLSLHFESASAVFYIPLLVIFSIWQRKNLPDFKTIVISGATFFATLIPQILFNLRHNNILLDNFKKLFFEERAFRVTTKFILEVRSEYFWSVFSTKLFPSWRTYAALFVILAGLVLLVSRYKFKKLILPLFAIFLITPMVGYLLFQGNYGNIYDYYMSGYFLPFILLFGIGLGELWKKQGGFIAVLFFFYLFFASNGVLIKNYITATVKTRPISLEEELKAVDWVFENARGRGEFNVDIYVPPVIPHSYEYLFLWQATKRCGENLCNMVKDEQVSLLYLLYEEDPPHPERLEAWMDKQAGIGKVEEEAKFGGITVQRRKRL
jgi:4-amino-4-deoxy-L-arabinose transferase-like glycosyltransferase